MRRVARVGFLQRRVLPLFGLYPWECPICREVKILHKRGKRVRRSRRVE